MEFAATAAVMDAEVANANKMRRQDVSEEATNKINGGDGHAFQLALIEYLIPVIKILESDLPVFHIQDAMIADGDTEDITAKILDQFFRAIERTLYVYFPVGSFGFREHLGDIELTLLGIERTGGPELTESGTKSKFEASGELFGVEKEVMFGRLPAIAIGRIDESATGHDGMNMGMLLDDLSSGM